MTNHLFHVSAAKFHAASLFTSTDPHRKAILETVHIEPDHAGNGAVLFATNGHIMAAIHDPLGFCAAPVSIKPDKAMLRNCKTAQSIDVCGKNRMNFEGLIDRNGSYPDVRSVIPHEIPSKQPETPAAFDSKYLAVFDKAAHIVAGLKPKEPLGMRVYAVSAHAPALVFFDGHDMKDFLGVIMPREWQFEEPVMPDWLAMPQVAKDSA